MAKLTLDLSETEMRDMAEICALVLSLLGQVQSDIDDSRAKAWQRLCIDILKMSRAVPSIGKDMELNPDCGYWFFKRPYIDAAFYSDVLEEYRDSSFWSELVSRAAEQSLIENLGQQRADALSDEERAQRTSSLEKALWNEVTRHGLDRMMFLLPGKES